jgi:hypothetical protein
MVSNLNMQKEGWASCYWTGPVSKSGRKISGGAAGRFGRSLKAEFRWRTLLFRHQKIYPLQILIIWISFGDRIFEIRSRKLILALSMDNSGQNGFGLKIFFDIPHFRVPKMSNNAGRLFSSTNKEDYSSVH